MASNEWLVRKLHEQDKKIEALSRGGTGVGHTSIAPGENLTVISDNGEVVLGAGGVDHVDGPTPATPSAPTLKLGFGTIETTWDGTFAEGEDEDGVPLTAPVDFDVVEVHCSTDPEEEEWGDDTRRGQIKTREGGTITVGGFDVDDEVFVCLIALAKTGKRSAPSATASLVIEGLDFAQLTNELDAATVTIDNAREVLLDGQNTLGEKLDAADTALSDLETSLGELDETTLPALRNDLDAAEGRLTTAEGQITDAFGELDAVPGQIADAKQAAIDAAALDATGKADAAQSAAEEKAALAQQAADDALAAINAGESMWADPGFESSFGPLGSTNPAVVRSNVFAYQGSWSVEYTTTGTGANVYPGYVTVPVTPGRTYRLSAAVRSDDGLAFESFFEQRAGGSTVVSSPKLEIAGGVGSFALGDATQTIVDGVSELRFAPLVPAAHNNVAGKKLYLDNFTLTDITESWAMFQEAMTAASDAQTVAGEAKAIAEAAVGAAEGGNTNFFNQSEPSGVGSLVGDRWFQRTATWAIIGMWMWDGSNWIRQTLNNEVIGNLDAGKITFGSMNGERIEAGSIYADRIVSGLSQNMVPDPGFVSPEINASRLLNNSSFGGTWDIADGVLSCDTNGGTMTNNSNFPLAATSDREAWSAYPGMTMVHRFSARVVGGSATVRGTAYTLRRDGTKAYSALTPASFQPITSEWKEYSFTTALGDDITSYSTALQVGRTSTGVVEFKAPFSASMVGTTVIEGGAITTNKLAANVLEVGNLKAGTAAIAEAVVQKIAASTASIQQADVGNLFVTGTSSLSDVVAERIASDTAKFIELEVGNLVAGTGTMDEATIQKLFSDVVVASMAQAEQFIGENAILTGAVTAPKITASEELWAKIAQFVKIRAEQIQSDAIDGMVITGGTYRTSGGNGSWSDAGLFINQPDGTSMVRFPTDGSPLSLTASDTQIERASIGEFDLSYGAVRSGGEFTLASGVTAPASPPELSAGWALEAQLPRPAEPSMDWTGLAYWNGLYVRGVNVLGSDGDPYDRIELYNPDGTLNRSINIDLNPRAGVAVIGDIVYTIGPDHNPNNKGKQWCHGFNLNTGARVSRWEFTHFWAASQKKIAIGVDGSNLMVAGVDPNAVLYVFKYTPSTGALVGSQMSTNFDVGYAADIHGVATAGGNIYVSPRGQVREYTVSGSTLTKTAGFAWDNPNWNSGGFTFAGGVPVVVDSGAVYTGSAASDEYTAEMCYTWYNGTYETTPSPVATVKVAPREWATISLPARAGLQKRLYFRKAGTDTYWARSAVPDDVTASAAPIGLAIFSPPTTNTFPSNVPAVLKSATGNFEVNGNGGGKWGPLTFNTDGSMSGMRRMAAGRVTIAVTDQQKGYETATVNFPTGRFTSPPAVTVGANSTAPVLINVGVLSVTAEQATIAVRRTTTTPTVVDWIATEID